MSKLSSNLPQNLTEGRKAHILCRQDAAAGAKDNCEKPKNFKSLKITFLLIY